MSELSERVLAAVGQDWTCTRDIIESLPSVGVARTGFENHVRHHLRKWERYGRIERRWTEDGRSCEWRRVG